jgi:hypothetical protein
MYNIGWRIEMGNHSFIVAIQTIERIYWTTSLLSLDIHPNAESAGCILAHALLLCKFE